MDILDSLSFFISIKGQDLLFQDIYFIKFLACIVIEQLIFNSLILNKFEYIYKYNLKNFLNIYIFLLILKRISAIIIVDTN